MTMRRLMMHRTYYFLLLLPLAVVFSSCGETDKDAPNTVVHASPDIVTCLVDSTPWEAASDKSIAVIEEVVSAEIDEIDGKQAFILTAWNVKSGVASSISIYAEGVESGASIELDGKSGRATYTSKPSASAEPVFYKGPDRPHGSLTITSIDTVTKRITGSFYCDLGGLKIENGQFGTEYSLPVPF